MRESILFDFITNELRMMCSKLMYSLDYAGQARGTNAAVKERMPETGRPLFLYLAGAVFLKIPDSSLLKESRASWGGCHTGFSIV